MKWLRWYTGCTTDPKFQVIAKHSGQSVAAVIALWAMLLERACSASERGAIDGFDSESADVLLGLADGASKEILHTMQSRGLIEQGRIAKWEVRQPRREREDNSTERVRQHRERQKPVQRATLEDVTPCNATEHQGTPRLEESRRIQNPPPPPPQGMEISARFKRERKTNTGPTPLPDAFAEFWAAYPRKVGRHAAEKAWVALTKANALPDINTLLAAIENQAVALDWTRDSGRFCPYPATWLNNRRWDDVISAPNVSSTWHKYRPWASDFLERRAQLLPTTPAATQALIDAGAKALADHIGPDGFTEDFAREVVSWILAKPERANHVASLANITDRAEHWGLVITWASNGARGMAVGDDPHKDLGGRHDL